MPVVIPNAFDNAAVLTGLQLDENSQAIEDYTASIPGSDLQAATIANSKLTNKHYEFLVTLRYQGTNVEHATIPRDIVMLPGVSGTEGSYTVLSASYALIASGTGAVTFGVQWGYFNAGTWTEVTVASADVIAVASTGAVTAAGQSGACTILTSALPLNASAAVPYGLGLIVTGDGNLDTSIANWLSVTLKLKRTDGLRA